jgi:enoyl-CoA hydratase/carnithine racemase
VGDADSTPSVGGPDIANWSESGDPLVVIDLDAEQTSLHVANVMSPIFVVGHSANASDHSLQNVDVALTTARAPGRSWVRVDDVDDAIATLSAALTRNPIASVVAAQVFRSTQKLDAAEALLVESLAYGMLQGGSEYYRWLARARHDRHDLPQSAPDVTIDRVGDDLTLTFNRPRQRNAYRARTRDELIAGLEFAIVDDTIDTVHLRGSGPSFGSGGDLSEFGTVPDGATGHLIRSARNAVLLLSGMTTRTVAHMNGPCYGAGVELSAACSRVIAERNTTMTLPEVAMGLIPGAGGTWSIARRVGRHRATWLAVSGETIDVERALDWGLVDEVMGMTTTTS